MPQTLCLNMIVKNESHVIRRCLDSVRPFVDTWVIVDTGSTDGTQDIIREQLTDLPGELHERPWKDFGHNRTEALDLAKGMADYTLVVDADEVLIAEPGFERPSLTADAYQTLHRIGDSGHSFYLMNIVRSALPWRYVGVLHEVMTCDSKHTTEKLEGLVVKGFFDGARNVDPKKKYENDAAILEEALAEDPYNARYVFYLAQSYRDADQLRKSLECYEMRVVMGGWPEEVWYALYQIAQLGERLGDDFAFTLEACLRAYQYRPERAEPLCQLSRLYREKDDYALAYLFAQKANSTPRPADILFLDESVYDWRSLNELAIASFYTGQHDESADACRRLLDSALLPQSQRARVIDNLNFALRALGRPEYRESG